MVDACWSARRITLSLTCKLILLIDVSVPLTVRLPVLIAAAEIVAEAAFIVPPVNAITVELVVNAEPSVNDEALTVPV